MEEPIIITRQELFEKVWTIPLTQIAKQFGVSNIDVKKICKKLNVPTPQAGYWQKLKFNKPVKKEPLPVVADEFKTTYTIDTLRPKNIIRKPVYAEGVKRIKVPLRLNNPHRLIQSIINQEYGKDHVYLNVSEKLKLRALRIMDTLLKELEAKGCKIRNELRKNYIQYEQFSIEFTLYERTTKVVPEKPLYTWQKYEFVNTGDLILKIDNWFYDDPIRRRFADTDKIKVEDMLDDFIHYIFIGFQIKREWERKRLQEEEERKRIAQLKKQEELRIQEEKEELERRRIEKENRIKQLERYSFDYKKSTVIEEFINQVKILYSKNAQIQKQLLDWIRWASETQQRLNPFISGTFFEFVKNFTYPNDD